MSKSYKFLYIFLWFIKIYLWTDIYIKVAVPLDWQLKEHGFESQHTSTFRIHVCITSNDRAKNSERKYHKTSKMCLEPRQRPTGGLKTLIPGLTSNVRKQVYLR